MKTLFRLGMSSAVFAAFLALTGCLLQEDRVTVAGGGEDFPNTVQPLGKVASLNLTAQTQYFYYATGGPKIPNVVQAADSAAPKGLTKRAGLDADTLQDYITDKMNLDGSVQHTEVRASPGPDGDITTHEDNVYVNFLYARTRGTDTLESLVLKDADGDGVFWGAGDSGTVEMDYWGKNPSFRPQANSVSLTMKIRFYHDGDSAVLLSYAEQDFNSDGGISSYKASGVRGDSTIRLVNDTLLLTIDQTPGSGTGMPLSHALYRISVGGNRKATTDDSLLGYSIENTWPSGAIRHSVFEFTPVPRVVWKTPAKTGSFTLSTQDSADGTQNLIGTYQNSLTDVDLRGTTKGRPYHYRVVYDSAGNLIDSTALSN